MKVLCDVHITFKLISFFKNNGIETEYVNNKLNSFFTTGKTISEYVIRICLGNIPTAALIIIFESKLEFLKKLYQSTPKFYLE